MKSPPDEDRSTKTAREEPPDGETSADDDPLRLLLSQLAELGEYGRHFASARIDALRVNIRRGLLWVIGGCLGFVAGIAAAVIAIAYVVEGTSRAITVLMGGREWAGPLFGGALILFVLAGVVILPVAWHNRSSKLRTKDKYERRKAQQRMRFGHTAGNKNGKS